MLPTSVLVANSFMPCVYRFTYIIMLSSLALWTNGLTPCVYRYLSFAFVVYNLLRQPASSLGYEPRLALIFNLSLILIAAPICASLHSTSTHVPGLILGPYGHYAFLKAPVSCYWWFCLRGPRCCLSSLRFCRSLSCELFFLQEHRPILVHQD